MYGCLKMCVGVGGGRVAERFQEGELNLRNKMSLLRFKGIISAPTQHQISTFTVNKVACSLLSENGKLNYLVWKSCLRSTWHTQ